MSTLTIPKEDQYTTEFGNYFKYKTQMKNNKDKELHDVTVRDVDRIMKNNDVGTLKTLLKKIGVPCSTMKKKELVEECEKRIQFE
jgi:hypothetical protein